MAIRDILCGVPFNMGIFSFETEIQKIKYAQTKQLSSMEAFLASIRNSSTKSVYQRGIELFVTFYGKTVEEIVAERKDDCTPRPNENIVALTLVASH